MNKKNALILVDLQKDFMQGGALAVENANDILPVINRICQNSFDKIVATKDWHPFNHVSFADNHDKEPGMCVRVSGGDQILWPRHCVQNSPGAEFHPGWPLEKIDHVVQKGTDPLIDSYSTFFDNDHLKETGLHNFLRAEGIHNLYIAGLATDYCVKYSALDAKRLGYHVFVIQDACRAVNLHPEDGAKALEEMRLEGIEIIHSHDLTRCLKTPLKA